MIEVKELNKSFEGKKVLHDINTVFEDGIINMIIGSSGSGKTVLLKCIIGLLKPDSGSIFYDNRDFCHLGAGARKKVRQEVGMLFQSAALFNSLTVAENVGFPLKIFSTMTPKEKLRQIESCLERVDLHDVKDLYPSELSGGMQKRVGLARAIVMNPKYLFCDEPNSGLDPKTSRVIDQLIKELTIEYNTTTIINSHDMTSVFEISDKVFFVNEGKIWWEGQSDEINDSENEKLLQMVKASGYEQQSSLNKDDQKV